VTRALQAGDRHIDPAEMCAEHHIAVEAWSPIAQGQVLDDPAIALIAERVRKSPAQVVLRGTRTSAPDPIRTHST
jgi:diketogulonate reductase-like aldo/keto reductase